ncbi:MAG: hypothetical protein LBC77_07495 [Spirochaetaceae bacterium]|jgi:hypothetical protein|nr:hypothetical protein [Spirochaetaceae bacterium]
MVKKKLFVLAPAASGALAEAGGKPKKKESRFKFHFLIFSVFVLFSCEQEPEEVKAIPADLQEKLVRGLFRIKFMDSHALVVEDTDNFNPSKYKYKYSQDYTGHVYSYKDGAWVKQGYYDDNDDWQSGYSHEDTITLKQEISFLLDCRSEFPLFSLYKDPRSFIKNTFVPHSVSTNYLKEPVPSDFPTANYNGSAINHIAYQPTLFFADFLTESWTDPTTGTVYEPDSFKIVVYYRKWIGELDGENQFSECSYTTEDLLVSAIVDGDSIIIPLDLPDEQVEWVSGVLSDNVMAYRYTIYWKDIPESARIFGAQGYSPPGTFSPLEPGYFIQLYFYTNSGFRIE